MEGRKTFFGGRLVVAGRPCVVKTAAIPDGEESVTYTTRVRNTEYVRAEVPKPGGAMAALTNPIFVGRK